MTNAMKYEDAIKAWGGKRLAEVRQHSIDLANSFMPSPPRPPVDQEAVTVTFDFSEGYACCGGRDPDCYCSYAESPRAEVVVEDGRYSFVISMEDFDFAAVLGEIVEAGGGVIST